MGDESNRIPKQEFNKHCDAELSLGITVVLHKSSNGKIRVISNGTLANLLQPNPLQSTAAYGQTERRKGLNRRSAAELLACLSQNGYGAARNAADTKLVPSWCRYPSGPEQSHCVSQMTNRRLIICETQGLCPGPDGYLYQLCTSSVSAAFLRPF